jgi:hypothetical protein
MNKTVIQEKYLVNTQEIAKSNTTYTSVDEIETFIKTQIEAHPVVSYIATFDHYAHTASLEGGMIPADIKAAKNVLCCFGMAIPSAVFVGVKPMSIAIVETTASFVLSFIEAPAASAQSTMEAWVAAIENK